MTGMTPDGVLVIGLALGSLLGLAPGALIGFVVSIAMRMKKSSDFGGATFGASSRRSATRSKKELRLLRMEGRARDARRTSPLITG